MFDLNKEYYLWGAGTYGGRLIDFMDGNLNFKAVIDSDTTKHGTLFHGVEVIGYDKSISDNPNNKLILSQAMPHEVRNFLLKEGYQENEDFFLIYDFLPRYFWQTRRKVVASHANLIATTICNLNCDSCQAYMNVAEIHRHISASEITKGVDLMYKHVDSILNINYPCGESLLNKELTDACQYIYDNYKDRYHAMTIQTNGTIIPDDETMKKLASSKTVLSISDYEANKKTKYKLIEKCNVFGVQWFNNSTCKRENWYDFADSHVLRASTDFELKEHFKKCWIPGMGVFEQYIYLCTIQAWSHAVVGMNKEFGERSEYDVFDMTQPKTETSQEVLYKLISRQLDKGYISHCARCDGTTPIVDKMKKMEE